MERTLLLIKPDGVRRGLVGEVLRRLERRGFRLVGLKMVQIPRSVAERHYIDHRDKGFYENLLSFITSGALVAAVIQGEGAIQVVRQMTGATDPRNAQPGTLRGDFALSITENVVHASDNPEKAEYEIPLFFTPSEIYTDESTN